MTHMHAKEVNKIAECYLLPGIINPPKRAKNINSHYYPILYGCMNTRKDRLRFKKFWIILDSGCSFTIVTVRIVEKLHPEKDAVMQWHTQAGNVTTNLKVKVYFTLPTLSTMNVVTCKCYVNNYAKGIYNMILGKYPWT